MTSPTNTLSSEKHHPTTIQDPRFQSVHHDPRFIKPSARPRSHSKSHPHLNLRPSTDDDRFQDFNRRISSVDSKSKRTKSSIDSNQAGLKQRSIEIPKLVDYARGRVILESSDDEDHLSTGSHSDLRSSDSDSDSEQDVELGPGSSSMTKRQPRDQTHRGSSNLEGHLEIDLNEPEWEDEEGGGSDDRLIQPTQRIAIVNLDWDNLKPIDIYKVVSSLLIPNHSPDPTGPEHDQSHPPSSVLSRSSIGKPKSHQDQTLIRGQIKSVKFYKSQFGKERMKVEDVEGPPKEIFKSNKPPRAHHDLDEEEDAEYDSDDARVLNGLDDTSADFDEDALRKYQLDRLRYFYAIVELDSVLTAHHVFNQIDGTEFERTANIFDLSYVPDDMTFDDEDLWDECQEDCNDYKGVDFSTDVLRHSKVKLTWDSEDPVRKNYTRLNTQKLTQEELDQMDFKNFLAPPSSDEEEEASKLEEEGPKGIKKNPKIDFNSHMDPDQFQNIRKLLGLSSFSNQELDHPDRSQFDGADDQASEEQLDITFKPGFIDLDQDCDGPPSGKVTLSKKSKNQRIKDKLKIKSTEIDHQPTQKSVDQPIKTDSSKKSKNHRKDQDELELLLLDDDDDRDLTGTLGKHDEHFDLNQIMKLEKLSNKKSSKKTKRRLKQKLSQQSDHGDSLVDEFSIDSNDPRFSKRLINDPEFAIDPSNPQFKKTRSMVDLLTSTRQKRTQQLSADGDDDHRSLKSPKTAIDPDRPNLHDSSSTHPPQVDRSVRQLVDHLKSRPSPNAHRPSSKRTKLTWTTVPKHI